MVENSEKFLSFDEFKEKVYKNIGTLEALEDFPAKEALETERPGCFGIIITPFFVKIFSKAGTAARHELDLEKLNAKADLLLAQKEIKDLLCAKLDATIVLPIDAAYKLTPVLYGLALEDEEKVPFDSMLFAVICRKIIKEGVENYCGQAPTAAAEEKKTKASGRKRARE